MISTISNLTLPTIQIDASVSNAQPTLFDKIKYAFWIGLGSWTTYNLIDRGLSQVLILETLSHGTSPYGYLGIMLFGAKTAFGGTAVGSSAGLGHEEYINASKNYFHVFKDTAFAENCLQGLKINEITGIPRTIVTMTCQTGGTLLPRIHAILSGKAMFQSIFSTLPMKVLGAISGAISGYLTPTLRFRFTPEEILNCQNNCLFENDPDYNGFAYRTAQDISASHLGITGSLMQGMNEGIFDRMAESPDKVIFGGILLILAAISAFKTYSYFKKGPGQNSGKDNVDSETYDPSSNYSSIMNAITGIFFNIL